ncbi:MAG: heavy-metal-associated domain-containing protein [Proteobacteria bacterium]|nr:heavy-metal-associated domain-containing protein [Pseudomonadota bacterium]MBU1708428.1 heavy-metal-associated domain-containing protein [Pseudomonadota bacterium]
MEDSKTLRLLVEGIVCTGCAQDMETVLKDTEGILDVSVDYAEGTITMEYEPDEISEKELFIKVRKFGFNTKII